MINRILYATDLGMYGPYLMEHVAALVQSTGAKVDILHVVEPMGLFAESVIDSYMPEKEKEYLRSKGLSEIIEKIRLQVIDTLNSEYANTLKLINLDRVEVKVGEPSKVILKQSGLVEYNLIVMAGHSQQECASGMLGGVTERVLKASKVPVYVLPRINLEDIDRG